MEIIFNIFGGMGLFLFGIYIMGEALKGLAGSKLRMIIEKTTNRVWKGILMGAVLTAILQSSSGVTAIVIGLISAGLMKLPQAIAVIMGANIGTTITAFLVGLDIKEYSLAIVAIGAMICFFVRNKKINFIGTAILGFGLLFYGLKVMDSGLSIIAEMDFFEKVMRSLDNPFLGVITGTVITAIIQSSSAAIAILQQIYATTIEGVHSISLSAAIAVVLGSNIGTTITAVLSSLGSTRTAKRAALAHVMFNVIGTLLFLCILAPFTKLMQYCEDHIAYLYNTPQNTIAFVHIIFNGITTLILAFCIPLLVKIVEKLIPFTDEEKLMRGVDQLEPSLLKKAPVLALENAKKVIVDMSTIVSQMFDMAKLYIHNNDNKLFSGVQSFEDVVDGYDNKLHDYLMALSGTNLSEHSTHEQSIYFDTIRDLERIADHCVNLTEFMQERYANNDVFQQESLEMIDHMLDILSNMVQDSFTSFQTRDKKLARRVRALEPMVDELEKKYRRQEINMLTTGVIQHADADLHFVDILANLERIGDHTNNIADNILQDSIHNITSQLPDEAIKE